MGRGLGLHSCAATQLQMIKLLRCAAASAVQAGPSAAQLAARGDTAAVRDCRGECSYLIACVRVCGRTVPVCVLPAGWTPASPCRLRSSMRMQTSGGGRGRQRGPGGRQHSQHGAAPGWSCCLGSLGVQGFDRHLDAGCSVMLFLSGWGLAVRLHPIVVHGLFSARPVVAGAGSTG